MPYRNVTLFGRPSIPRYISKMKFLNRITEHVDGYRHSAPNGKPLESNPQQREECERILERFLRFNLASCYLAKYGEQLVGIIVLSRSFSIGKGYPVLRIEALYTLPQYRKMGVGRQLMKYAIELAKEQKATRLQLETDDENLPARSLYTDLGFQLLSGKGVYMLFH